MSIPRQGTAVRGLAHYTIFVFYLYFYLPFSGELGVDSGLDHRVAACVYNCHIEAAEAGCQYASASFWCRHIPGD